MGEKTEDLSATTTWSSWYENAVRNMSARLLAELLLAEESHFMATGTLVHQDLAGRLPAGQPPKAMLRRSAEKLLAWADSETDADAARVWRILGLLWRWSYPQHGDDNHDGELRLSLEDTSKAADLAEGFDEFLGLLALVKLTVRHRDMFNSADALAAADRMINIARGPVPTAESSKLHQMLPDASWMVEPGVLMARFKVRSHQRAAAIARFSRQYERAVQERDLQIVAAEQLSDVQPGLLADALGQRASLARSLGDVRSSLALLARQADFTNNAHSNVAESIALRSIAANAGFFADWGEMRAANLARLANRLSAGGHDGTNERDPDQVRLAVEDIYAKNQQRLNTAIGNIADDLARNLLDSGAAAASTDAAVEARKWLDVADAAWRDIAMNGKVAISFRRLQLDVIEGRAPKPLDVGRTMVGLSREWRRAVGQRRAALEAGRCGSPGDHTVLERLMELRSSAPALDAAHLDAGIAQWYLNAGDQHHEDAQKEQAISAWTLAWRTAESAAEGLVLTPSEGAPFILDPKRYIEAIQTEVSALESLYELGGKDFPGPREALSVRIRSLPAIARLYSSSVSREQRELVTSRYSNWLNATAETAANLGAPAEADFVAEVARRDLVGTVLSALSNDADIPEHLAALAKQFTATLKVAISEVDDEGEDSKADLENRAVEVNSQMEETLDVIGAVLGPVAQRLFDPTDVIKVTAEDVLNRLHGDEPGAVLSLWLTGPEKRRRIVRRLAYRTHQKSAALNHIDVVDAPDWLAGFDPSIDSDLFNSRLELLTTRLLPQPLLEFVLTRDPENPVDITIVPTGLLGIPFSALALDRQHLLLDLASVTVVQSLNTAMALSSAGVQTEEETSPAKLPFALAVFDTEELTHTKAEMEELILHHPQIKEVKTLEEIGEACGDASLQGAAGLLALAVHGLRGLDGWSQRKKLPSGQYLTTAHILEWYFPKLIVAGSCNTDIRANDLGELGGFPMAFQLRGAATIIGSLHAIPDEATAQIMGLLYASLAAGSPPSQALRQAQRSWIAADRENRRSKIHRWSYLIAYGLAAR